MKARDIMTTAVVTVCPGHHVRHAARIMLERSVNGLPVVGDDGNLVGIVTEGDLLPRSVFDTDSPPASGHPPTGGRQKARDYVRAHSWKVGDLMTTEVITVEDGSPVGRIAALMDEHRIKRLPVMRQGSLAGIVSRADMLPTAAAARSERPMHGDEAIRRAILSRLDDVAEFEGARPDVAVSDGIVHLRGEVASQSARRAACVVAEGVPGVAGVADQLRVGGEGKAAAGIAESATDTRGKASE